jgi:hypothetical protein
MTNGKQFPLYFFSLNKNVEGFAFQLANKMALLTSNTFTWKRVQLVS